MKLKYVLAGCAALIILGPLATAHLLLRASLPKLDGEISHLGVSSPVTLERDDLGVPTIEAANRVDLAYGIGFAHGQDRFFEMDLSRRLAAGELSEMFGPVALEQDKKARLFRFRHVAQATLQQGSAQQRAVLEAYARGVNAGLASLRSRPWEYWLLRVAPTEWRPEDTVLVSHAMWWDLQYGGIEREIVRQEINARMQGPDCAGGWKCSLRFLYPPGTEWDAPNAPVGLVTANNVSEIPPPDILNVRGKPRTHDSTASIRWDRLDTERGIGSNNWAVAGRLTTTGSALIANDMHLRARVPPVWYHARMRIKGAGAQPTIDLNGVTLPGAPLLVAGSNGHIAWGFTNSYGNWIHVEKAVCASGTATAHEEIRVHGQQSVDFPVVSSPAGVLYQVAPERSSCWFVSWLVQQPAATNFNLIALEQVTSVAAALDLAPTFGIPHQNFVVGDRDGHIAWTIAGRIPAESGPERALGSSTWTTIWRRAPGRFATTCWPSKSGPRRPTCCASSSMTAPSSLPGGARYSWICWMQRRVRVIRSARTSNSW